MASTYSTNLAIELIGTGDQAGSWGNTTNTNLGTLIEQAISGYVTQAVSTGTDTTITIPNGATGVARNMYIELTGTGGASTNLIVPANKKLYFIFNNTSSGQVTVKVSGQTGVSVPNKAKIILVSDGTDVVDATNYIGNISAASANITVLTSASATITNLIATSASITTLTNNPTFSGGTANGVLYLNGSKVATSGSALTFDGSDLATSGNFNAGSAKSISLNAASSSDTNRLQWKYQGVSYAWIERDNSTGDMAFGVQSSERMRLTSTSLYTASGINVGIGTSSPGARLSVDSGSTALNSNFNSTNASGVYVRFQNSGTSIGDIGGGGSVVSGGTAGDFAIASRSGNLVLGTGSVARATIDSSGNLGIGTSSPAFKLQVIGNSQFAVNSAGTQQILQLNNSDTTAGVQAAKLGFSSAGVTKCSITGAVYGNGYMAFATNDDTEKMRISADGTFRVKGAGTAGSTDAVQFSGSAPASALLLDSSGNLGLGVTPSAWQSSSGASWDVIDIGGAGALAFSPAGSNDLTLATNAYYDNTDSRWEYKNTGDKAARYSITSGGTHAWYTTNSTGTANTLISFGDAKMTLDASGNLLVGTTSGSNKLTVNGDAVLLANGDMKFADATNSHVSLITNSGAASTSQLEFWTGNPVSERARITSGGYSKFSNDGTYANSTGAFHEFRQSTSSDATLAVTSSNGSYTSAVILAQAARAANSAYDLLLARSNDGGDTEFNLRGDGNAYADGTWNNNGADYAEFFESATGGALTVGATVVLEGNKVRESTASDPASAIMGVVRPKEPGKASMVVGNTAWNKWANKYLTDDFDRYIMENHDVVEWTDEDGKQHSYESHNIPAGVTVPVDAIVKSHDENGNKFQHYKLNPAWDKDAEYTPREKRDEWIIIGLVGQVKVLKGKPVNDRWIKMRDVSAAVEEWMIR